MWRFFRKAWLRVSRKQPGEGRKQFFFEKKF
jgi:hypothetical protein